MTTARSALSVAAGLGPFFDVDDAPRPGWVSWADVVDRPEPLARRVAEVGALLASGPGAPHVPARIAASIVQLGLVARLLSPVLGAALAAGVLPAVPADRVHLDLTGTNPVPMAFTAPSAVPVGGASEVAAALDREWVGLLVGPLNAAVARRYRLSPQVLEGNLASAVAGALRVAATARPDLAGAGAAVLDHLLAEGSLAGRGHHRSDGAFLRRSCCLLYRLPGAGTCGDCVLRDR